MIDRGEGSYVIDAQGKKYLDGVSSLWVTVHGHRKAQLDEALKAQVDKIAHSTMLGLANRPAIELAQKLVEIAPRTLSHPADYATRANFVRAASCALNGWISPGVPQDWSTHTIGHELTALHGIDHARTLAIVLPSLLHTQRNTKRAKLLQYADRVWDLRDGPEDARIDGAIAETRGFYESLGIRTRLADYHVSAATTAPEVARRLAERGLKAFGERGDLTPDKVVEILTRAA